MSFLASLFTQNVEYSTGSFETEGHRIVIDRYSPSAGGIYPVVIGLHGSGGLHGSFGEPARMLAASGFAVFVPHYFERTGTGWANDSIIRREFPTWMRTIRDAITYATMQPGVDPERVGLLGFSLGGFLALSIASLDERVKAVVEYFGGLPEEFAGTKRMPPVLILHGEADSVVPVAEARKLDRVLRVLEVPYEKQIYPGAGHGFTGMTMVDSAQRTLAFLQKYLG